MSFKNRTHIPRDTPRDLSLAPKALTKEEFGRRLYSLMLSKGWNQSELSRQTDVPRDSISMYVRGKTLPTALSLEKLAVALGVSETELLPNHTEGAIAEDTPAFEIRQSPNTPNTAWLRVNRLVTLNAALKIADILANDNAIDGR
jgi:transcriptional regulator with XRE-family HTH domain